MECPACHDPIPPDSRFCPHCGASLPSATDEPVLPARLLLLRAWMERMWSAGDRRAQRYRTRLAGWPRHRRLFAVGSLAAWLGFLLALDGRRAGLAWLGIGIVLLITAQYIREEDQHRKP